MLDGGHSTIPEPRSLIAATRPFIKESPARSWYYVLSTFVILAGGLTGAALAPWPWRLIGTVAASLVLIRGFVLYHDHMHGALLRRSKLARAMFVVYGLLMLTPPRAWKSSHNYHHAHVGKVEGSERGNFWLMTTQAWNEASTWTRIYYRFARSIWVILFAYVFVFAFSITLLPLIRDPKRHWDSAISLALHGGIITGIWLWQGTAAALLIVIVPMTISTMIGAYFFYAQHTYVGMDVLPDDEWTVVKAAVTSCSYLKLGPVMKWISGDIGYHHVHHLNAAIPFYRLADAKRAIPELKDPIITTLRPRDILRCLRLKLWDGQTRELVPFPPRHES
jgi:omega-6 fatty acid desaturase (delta-12 desaturase)